MTFDKNKILIIVPIYWALNELHRMVALFPFLDGLTTSVWGQWELPLSGLEY